MTNDSKDVREVLSLNAGDQLELVPFIGGQPCPFVDLIKLFEHETKQLAAYTMIRNDLDTAISMLECITGQMVRNEIACQGLFYSSIFMYGRCFTDAAEGRKVKLEATSNWLGPETKMKSTHETIMKMRHKFLAHGGETEFEFIHLKGVLNPDINNKSVIGIAPFIVTAVVFDGTILSDHLNLYRTVRKNVDVKVTKLNLRLLEKLRSEPIEKLYENAIFPKA